MNENDLSRLLNAIKSEEDFSESLIALDNMIKVDAKLREDIPDEFYKVLYDKLRTSVSREAIADTQLITKCLKNSAAAFKMSMNDTEKEICQTIIDYLNRCISSNDSSFDLNIKKDQQDDHDGLGDVQLNEEYKLLEIEKCKHSIYQNMLQYIFNLIQGIIRSI